MARVTTVQKARKAQGNCRRCGKPIEKGDTYRWFANRIGRMSMRKVFCAEHYPRPSEMTTSDKLASLYGAQEEAGDELAALDATEADVRDFESIRDDAASTIREVAQEYEESADNMEDGFGHATYMSDEIRDKAQECESYADEVESVDFDDFDPEDHRPSDTYDNGDPRPRDVIDEHVADSREAWCQDQVAKLEEALGACPL